MSSLQAGWAADKEALQTAVNAATTVSNKECYLRNLAIHLKVASELQSRNFAKLAQGLI